MAFTTISLGILGFFFCTAFQKRFDPVVARTWSRLLTWGRRFLPKPTQTPSDLPLLQQVQAKLRAGQSLDAAIESLLGSEYVPLEQKRRLSAVLQGKPGRDFLSQFLVSAMDTGIPLLSSLTAIQRSLLSEKKLRAKAESVTSQARAQGEVLSWLPWVMCGAIFFLDREWFFLAAKGAPSWALWSMAFLLTGCGRIWMQQLLARALNPSGREAVLEEEVLPKLVLRLIAQLSLGHDAETALDRAWAAMEEPRVRPAFQAAARRDNALAQFQFLFSSAAATGAPLREDLLRFLEELHIQGEARWEGRVQRLPVVMMAPLFGCFFPGSLLVLLGLVLPLLRSF